MPVSKLVILMAAAGLAQAAGFGDAAPILRARCHACHSGATPAGGLALDTREAVLRGGKSGAAVVPGRPVDSLLMAMVSSGRMPQGGMKLTAAEVETIRQWIETEDARAPVAERDIQAILSAKCWVCHGRRERQAGLDLRTRASMLAGGKSGAAIVAGNPDASLLVKRVVAQEMPPPKLQEQYSVRGLTAGELEKLKRWIAEGAVAEPASPGATQAVTAKDREFWSLRSPRRPAVPPMPNGGRNAIDAFAVARGARLLPEAAPGALLRRAFFDLTGLPPAPEDVAAYAADGSPDRWEKLLSRLLASPHYGERWGRHWLDAAGYADSEGGNNSDADRPQAWRYRNYVVEAFQSNKPFDRFLTEQIAGDELFDYRAAKHLGREEMSLLAATGFWRMAPDGTNSTEQNFIPERMDVIAGQLEIFGSAVMGLSIGCARCHDHKYDPIPTRDYYRLVSILTPAYDPYAWLPGTFPCGGVGAQCDENNTRFVVAKASPEYAEAVTYNTPIEARVRELEKQIEAAPAGQKEALREKLRKERALKKPLPLVRALFDLGPEPPPTRILQRGDPDSPGALVSPGAPAIASFGIPEYRVEPLAHSSGRRLALAKWLTHPDHPLTARVMVNRIWMHHFGTGLVATPGNFGRMGAAPTNADLLDYLATEFVRSGWDVQAMHRLIMSSALYRQRTGDGGYPLRRLDAESLRDAILAAAGRLDRTPFGGADPIEQVAGGEVVTKSLRRSLYITQRRTRPVSLLETFDQPFLNPNCVERKQSVVASQALHLLNGELVRENARYMAGRVIDAAGEDAAAQVERAYLAALARRPAAEESRQAMGAMEALTAEWSRKLEASRPAEPVRSRARWLALSTLCHTLLNSAEFLYID